MGLRDTISKGFSKANDFVTEQQRRARLKESLESENLRLTSLFNELGKITYYGGAVVSTRDAQVVKDDITLCMNQIETLKQQLAEPAKS